MPSGAYCRVVQPGSGPKPTGDQRVKYDFIQWADDFDGDKVWERRGEVDRPSDCDGWEEEMWTDMCVGEVRRVILSGSLSTTGEDAYIEMRLLDIRTPVGPERPLPPPAAAATTAPNNDSSHEGFTLYPSGTYHQVVQQGSGPKATREQNVTVDIIEWRDDFDGPDKRYDLHGVVGLVSSWAEWEQEILTDMRVGEVRRVLVPGRQEERYLENSVGSERPPQPPPPPSAAAAPPPLAREEAAASDGSRRRSTGVLSRVVQQGSGPTPTRDQHIKADIIEWADDFDGQDKRGEGSGLEFGLSDVREWLQEMWTDMRVGEVRRVTLPAEMSTTGKDAYVEMRLLDITTPVGFGRPPPPAAAPTTAPNDDSSYEGFTLYPSGTYHQVVKEGSGPKPTHEQWVKYDSIEWRDDFDGRDKIGETRGGVYRVSRCLVLEWFNEIITDMRVGEVRRVFCPGGGGTGHVLRRVQAAGDL
ncbi:unnamed protein product [Vitrella brassicaformis CCMP3155]|uniref:Peptidylprolyl isomerase n=1 Tax=Vitrella brassicaformis (strain CCMP3155) TaxID=1169540 RepID=A0A0G4GPQ6_VITBC|nr:unnamed protein product [Vitrella brassicaformis CCMP3155]|eukprot:CEM32328.1 unnamed protein product [Vitrella brassicaformis CCMP3155]